MGVTQVTGARGRHYVVDGEKYPSVTTILGVIAKRALIDWAAKQEREAVVRAAVALHREGVNGAMPVEAFEGLLLDRLGKQRAHERQLEKAADIGSQAHRLVENSIRSRLRLPVESDVTDPHQAAVQAHQAFLGWAREVDLEPIATEQVVYSRTHQYAGTMDLLARVGGRVLLIDFKTSKPKRGGGIYPEHALQSAAYRTAVTEMGKLPTPEAGMIVRLPKTANDTVEPMEIGGDDLGQQFDAFLAALSLHRWLKQNE